MHRILLCLFFLSLFNPVWGQENYFSGQGNIHFSSEAEQEIITASSSNLIGVLNASKKTFFFKVIIRTFHGFNSSLQQEHFNEKYLESEDFPEASFYGKIIEDIDLTISGIYDIRAKGILKIHGIEMERIIKCNVTVEKDRIKIESHFSILLSDHKIKIPRVVHEKIANEIQVDIDIELPKNNDR
jgi:hypothetical protein